MSIKAFATLALATGLAVASPIAAPQSKRQSNNIFGNGFNGAVVNGFSGNGFNFGDGFNNFNQQQQVIQVQQQNLQIIDNGRQQQVNFDQQNVQVVDNGRGDQAVRVDQQSVQILDNGRQQQVVQQVNQVLVVDQVNNGFNNDLNNLFRKSNMRNQNRDVATVMLVVQEIQVAIDDGRGNQFQQSIFAQSAVVANRGARETNTVMIFDSRTLIAQDVLGNNAFNNIGQFGGVAGATGALKNALPTRTQGVQLFGAKPTWSSVAADPAATLGSIWQNELQDLQDNKNDAADMQLNEQIAADEKKKLDEAQKADQEQKKKDQEAAKQADEQKKQDEAKVQEGAAKNGTAKA
jgi:hypothetical protein